MKGIQVLLFVTVTFVGFGAGALCFCKPTSWPVAIAFLVCLLIHPLLWKARTGDRVGWLQVVIAGPIAFAVGMLYLHLLHSGRIPEFLLTDRVLESEVQNGYLK